MATIQVKRVELSKQFRDKIQYRLVHKEGMNRHEAKKAVEEMLEYLATPTTDKSPSERADQAWHSAILYTKDYQEFCFRNFGRMVHHVPVFPPPVMQKTGTAQCNCGTGSCAPCGKCHVR